MSVERPLTSTEVLSITWLLFSLALTFCAARIIIRLRVFQRLKKDDYLVLFAMICSLTQAILQTVMLHYTLLVQQYGADGTPLTPPVVKVFLTYGRFQWGVSYLFFTSLWAIKGSFLAFYDDLTKNLKWFRRAWWAIIAVTVLTYIGTLFAYGFLNGLHFGAEKHRNYSIEYQFSVDLFTDVLITILPLTLAFRVNFPRKRRLALAGIFSLTLIITLFSIIRYSLNNPKLGADPSTWIQVWSFTEQCVSIMIACSASFRTLAVNKNRQNSSSQNRGPRSYEQQNALELSNTPHSSNSAPKKKPFTTRDSSWSQLSG